MALSRFIVRVLAAAASIAASGCSIYPVVQESTGKDTFEIVRGIRCEARDAVIDRFRGFLALSRFERRPVYKAWTGEELSRKIQHNEFGVHEIDWNFLNKELASQWMYYLRSSISYDFLLDIEEKNDQGLTLDFNALRWGSASKLPLGLVNSRSRQVQRNFRVFDTWFELFTKTKWHQFCAIRVKEPNGEYPMAGYLNLRDMFRQYVNLNQSNNLAGLASPNSVFSREISDVAPTMSDTVDFTTQVEANLDPAVIVGQTVGRYTLVDFGLKLDNYRRDHHRVIVVVSLPPDAGGFASVRAQLAGKSIVVQSPRLLSAAELNRQNELNFFNSVNRIGSDARSFLGR